MRSPNYVSVHLQGNTKSSTPTRVPPEDADSCEIRLYLYFLKSFEGKVLQREVLDDSTSAETLYNPELKDSAYWRPPIRDGLCLRSQHRHSRQIDWGSIISYPITMVQVSITSLLWWQQLLLVQARNTSRFFKVMLQRFKGILGPTDPPSGPISVGLITWMLWCLVIALHLYQEIFLRSLALQNW